MSLIESFMDQLHSGLATVPKATADDVIQYYVEYFDDAMQAGSTETEVLAKTGSADQVVRAILDDLSIAQTQDRPNPLRLLRTSRRMLGKGVARAAKGTSFAILSIFPLTGAVILYLSAFVMALTSILVAVVLVFNIVNHPALSQTDILGQAGLIAALTAFCMASALILRTLANVLARLTLRLFRKIADRPTTAQTVKSARNTRADRSGKESGAARVAAPHKHHLAAKILTIVLLIFFFAGLTLAAATDLPQQYFRLWNSERPGGISAVTRDFPVGSSAFHTVRIEGLNTNISVLPSSDGKSRIVYDQAPYVSLESRTEFPAIQFTETANGRLPLFDWLAIHEGTTSMVLYLPGDTSAMNLEITSIGGDITVRVPYGSGKIMTGSGNIAVLSQNGSIKGTVSSRSGQVTALQ